MLPVLGGLAEFERGYPRRDRGSLRERLRSEA